MEKKMQMYETHADCTLILLEELRTFTGIHRKLGSKDPLNIIHLMLKGQEPQEVVETEDVIINYLTENPERCTRKLALVDVPFYSLRSPTRESTLSIPCAESTSS